MRSLIRASAVVNRHSTRLPSAFRSATHRRTSARRLEIHYTPVHGSWLNVAEIELSVLARQCLDRRLSSKEAVTAEVGPWEAERNRAGVRLVWSFRVADARRKLAHLYPQTT